MKKKGFTLMEVMLSIILFSLMVGGILGSYNSIQRASIKTANTQDAIQVAEDFLERINDMSIEYVIDTGKYTSDERFGHREIINTGTLYLINKNNGKETKFYRECNGAKCSVFISENGTNVNLISNEKVNVNNLNFEIYPNEQYVNTNITSIVPGGESLFKSGITLSTTIGFKKYTIYPGEITPETLCEDVCSASQLTHSTDTLLNNESATFLQVYNNNTSRLSSCVGKETQTNSILGGLIRRNTTYGMSIYEFATECRGQNDSHYVAKMNTTCGSGCSYRTGNLNPMSCGYIRKVLENNESGYTGKNCTEYDNYASSFACQQLCVASIFSCGESNAIKKTGILIETGERAGLYLQNPGETFVQFTGTVNGRKCQNGKKLRNDSYCLSWGSYRIFSYCEEYGYDCSDGKKLKCGDNITDSNYITEDQYKNGCKIDSQIDGYIYINEESNPEKEDCICQPRYGFSIYVDDGFVEDAGCAGGGEKKINTEGNNPMHSYVYNQPDLYYKTQQDDLKTRIGHAISIDDESYYGGKMNGFSNFNQCSCSNQDEYNTCIASGCCPDTASQVYQFEIDNTCNYTDKLIEVLDKGYYQGAVSCWLGNCYDGSKWQEYTKEYCNGKGGTWVHSGGAYYCYTDGITKKGYCENHEGTWINNTCYKIKEPLTCPNGIIQNNICYSNQATCSTIQNNICYSASEPLYCNGMLAGNLCYGSSISCNNRVGNTCYANSENCGYNMNNSCYSDRKDCSKKYNGVCYDTKIDGCLSRWLSNDCKNCNDKDEGSLGSFTCYKSPNGCSNTNGYINGNYCYYNEKSCDAISDNKCYKNGTQCTGYYNGGSCYTNPTNLETECTSRGGTLIINGSNINCYKNNTSCSLVTGGTCYTSENNLKSTCTDTGGYYTGKNGSYYCYTNPQENLQEYCNTIHGYMLNDVCYEKRTKLDTGNNGFMDYACKKYDQKNDSIEVARNSFNNFRGCVRIEGSCNKHKCITSLGDDTIKTNAKCESIGLDWDVLLDNQNSRTKRCEYTEFNECSKGENKNIYKDYSYGCELSMESQSNMILNIIDTIGNMYSSNNSYNGLWIFGFRIY